ncbi:hypothetical protein R6Q57_007034 [Mikania cordata]
MRGCHKGEKVKGIRELKLYLSHFGYLDYLNATNPYNDRFDEELEAAIKSYQVYYHLNATGTLDEPTVSRMVMPRCGFPDKETHHRIRWLNEEMIRKKDALSKNNYKWFYIRMIVGYFSVIIVGYNPEGVVLKRK